MPISPERNRIDLPQTVTLAQSLDSSEEPQLQKELHAGDRCPRCGQANLDYDGLLNLSCPNCGYALGGCFT